MASSIRSLCTTWERLNQHWSPLTLLTPSASPTSVSEALTLSLLCPPMRSASPCIRCLKPFTPSADDLREAGYQPVSTTAPPAPAPSTQPPSASAASSTSTSTTSSSPPPRRVDDSTEWEDFVDFNDEEDAVERGQSRAKAAVEEKEKDREPSARDPHPAVTVNPATPSFVPRPRNSPHATSPPAPAPLPPARPPDIDFFTNLGIASTTYTEPIRVQAKPRPAPLPSAAAQVAAMDPQVREGVVSKYGLDEIDEVVGWDELDLEDGEGGGGRGKAGKGSKKEKKKGLGAVALMED